MRIYKMNTYCFALIFYQILSTHSLRKYIKISLENLYVDIMGPKGLIGLNKLYTGCTSGSSTGKAYNKIFLLSSLCVSPGVVVMKQLSDSRQYLFFFFSSFLSFLLHLVFFSVIVVLYCFFLSIFLSHCLISCNSPISSNHSNS